MTLHQPWASLVVAGIKRCEGRTWDSDHRGQLFIHAASREAVPEEVEEVEERYKALYAMDPSFAGNLVFPKHYPTSCLLGCVTVGDVLPQQEHREAMM